MVLTYCILVRAKFYLFYPLVSLLLKCNTICREKKIQKAKWNLLLY